MENNNGPEKRTDIARPKDGSYASILEGKKQIAEKVKNFITENSDRIVRSKNVVSLKSEPLGGYEIENVILPTEKECMYKGKLLSMEFAKVAYQQNPFLNEATNDVSKNPYEGLTGTELVNKIDELNELEMKKRDLALLLKLGKYTEGIAFVDNAQEDNQRDEVIKYLSGIENKTEDEKEISDAINSDKLQGNLVLAPLQALLKHKYDKKSSVLGEKFVISDKMLHDAERLRREVSMDVMGNSFDRKKYDGVPETKTTKAIPPMGTLTKIVVMQLATQLAHDICVQYIEAYGEKEQKA